MRDPAVVDNKTANVLGNQWHAEFNDVRHVQYTVLNTRLGPVYTMFSCCVLAVCQHENSSGGTQKRNDTKTGSRI